MKDSDVSEAQRRVWKWREQLHQETKDMSLEEQLRYYRQTMKRVEQKTGIKLCLPSGRTKGKRKRLP